MNTEKRYLETPVCIKAWPETERPREKLLRFGPRQLSEAELLALVIGSGTAGTTALDLAKGLLSEYGDISVMASQDAGSYLRWRGLGPARAARISAAMELGRRVGLIRYTNRMRFRSPEEVVRFQRSEFVGLQHEIFKVLLLDSGNRIIRDVTISQGTLNASVVHPREVFKAAVEYLAAGIILVHNHPSGEPSPSREDRDITQQMIRSGQIMGIPVLDHIILAGNRYFSFSKEGLLKL
jgi:DNA repair protein RadC